ncbi:hypothetical protein AB0I81_60035 [Nonomuraea sp. NPDC050404]|uniref:hypothetical protein n=1 Tax=Nonomuraea sp. NPDC050404 TaxID=3155783 RepID=UPI003403969C
MGVINGQWWSMQWPWMVVWLLTVACFAVVLQYVLGRWAAARRRRRRENQPVPGICIFLHEARVEEVADILGIRREAALVSYEKIVSNGIKLFGKVLPFGDAGAGRDTSTQMRREYQEPDRPMKTIRLIMDTLQEKDMVVDADLATGQLVLTAGLADKLRGTEAQGVPLTAIGRVYISVSGLFTVRRDGDHVVLCARYGTGEPLAQMKITCDKAWVRDESRVDSFSKEDEVPATCLGRLRTWNSASAELALDPISIFQ